MSFVGGGGGVAPTQDETRHVAGDPANSCEEKENNKEGPGRAEDLGQVGEALQCH